MTPVALVEAVVPMAAGWLLVRGPAGERDPLAAAAAAPVLGTCALTLLANGLLPTLGFEAAYAASQGLLLLACALLLWRGRPAPLQPDGGGRTGILVLALVLGLTLLYAAAWQAGTPDPDYWTDFPQQALLGRGLLPPPNPFVPDLEMNGHYGRNLAVALAARAAGVGLMAAQHGTLLLWQAATVLLLFAGLRAWDATTPQALAGTACAVFGVAVGGWVGVLDSIYHHHVLAQAILALTFLLLARTWRTGAMGAGLVLGLALGAQALVFEIYLGLVALVVPSMLALARTTALGDPGPKVWRALAAAVVLALLLGATQGGPFTDLARRAWHGTEGLSPGHLNQAQHVTVAFPKEDWLQIHLQPWQYWRVSAAWTLPPLRQAPAYRAGPFYAPIWSAEVLRMHWLPLFLAPAVLVVLVRRRDAAGLAWWLFGAWSFLVPAVADFGPVYEAEYYRWEFAAGLGFAVAAGEALGGCWGRRGAVPATLLLLLILAPGFCRLAWPPSPLAGALGAPRGDAWFLAHAEQLGIAAADLEAARWLRRASRPGDRMVVNYPLRQPRAMASEATLVGLSGVPSVGHALPLPGDFVGTPPFRMAAAARLFWRTGDPETLRELDVDWLYARTGESPLPDAVPGVTLGHATGTRRVYSVDSPAPRPALPREPGLEVGEMRVPRGLPPGEVVPLVVRVRNTSSEAWRPGATAVALHLLPAGRPWTPETRAMLQILPREVPPGGEVDLPLHVAAPVEPGRYRLEVALRGPRVDRVARAPADLLVGAAAAGARLQARGLPPLRVRSVEAGPGGVRFLLDPMGGRGRRLTLRAGLALYSEARRGYVQSAQERLQDVELLLPERGDAEVVLPLREGDAGRVRADLFLATPQGESVLLRGGPLDLGGED